MEMVITGDKKLSIRNWAKKHRIAVSFAEALLECISDPAETPYVLEILRREFPKFAKRACTEARNALMRVQIHCSLDSHSDPIKVSKQLFVSQAVERLLFGSNLLFGEECPEEPAPKKCSKKKR